MYDRYMLCMIWTVFCVQAEDGIRDLVRSRGLGDVYKRQRSRRNTGLFINGVQADPLEVEASLGSPDRLSVDILSLIHI